MKTRINKSEVMRKAWEIIRNDIKLNKILGLPRYYATFSEALKEAWKAVKEMAAKYGRANERRNSNVWKSATYSSAMADTLTNYYAQNSYNGD